MNCGLTNINNQGIKNNKNIKNVTFFSLLKCMTFNIINRFGL